MTFRDASNFPILQAAVEGVGTRQPREDVFTAPGTWTRPPNVNVVQVIVVGGGGAGAKQSPSPVTMPVTSVVGGPGGGGGVRMGFVPVSSPVPITVGAGGSAAGPGLPTAGGTSSFGPLAPPVPPATFFVDGGGSGVGAVPGPVVPTVPNTFVPANGGGDGVKPWPQPITRRPTITSGKYGSPADIVSMSGGGALTTGTLLIGPPGGVGLVVRPRGRFGYGGSRTGSTTILGGRDGAETVSGRANTGAGGGHSAPGPLSPAGDGGSGIVIVRYWT